MMLAGLILVAIFASFRLCCPNLCSNISSNCSNCSNCCPSLDSRSRKTNKICVVSKPDTEVSDDWLSIP